jgi:hypothetical protein
VRFNDLLRHGVLALGIVIGLSVGVFGTVATSTFATQLSVDRAIIGAIVGGAIAGSITLIATLISNFFVVSKAAADERAEHEAVLASAFSKVDDLHDQIVKAYRHFFEHHPRLQLQIMGRTPLQKPLSGHRTLIEFSDSEKALGLKIRRASIYNQIRDASSLARSFYFLSVAYEERFHAFERKIIDNNAVLVEGKSAMSEAEIRPIDLMQLEDVLEHLRSFLFGAHAEMAKIHSSLLASLRDEFGASVKWEEVDGPAQAPNIFAE